MGPQMNSRTGTTALEIAGLDRIKSI